MSEETSTQEEQEFENSNVLNMSDEDLANLDPNTFLVQQDEKEPEEVVEEETEEEDSEVVEDEPEDKIYHQSDDSVEETSEEEQVTEQEIESSSIDYKAEYERLLSPFRASKREITVKSIDDARQLMQKGVDYQYKMEALKPQLKIMRALELNGLLDQDKINFLIDLDKKNPAAIKKFFKDKEIDPMEMDLSEETPYRPGSYAPSDQEIALDDVLDSIRDTPGFSRTIDELGNRWDGESKTLLLKNPEIISVINSQIGNGIYDQVMNIVASERMMGRLAGMNDLMAYKTVGDALQAQGAFNHLSQPESKPQRQASQDPKLKAKKRAASPTKRSSPAKTAVEDLNPLALSDDEFERMSMPNFASR